MYTSCAPALDGVGDGERCISLDTWHGYAYVKFNSPHLRVSTCEVAFVIRCIHTGGRHVSICSLVRWHYTYGKLTMLVDTTIKFRASDFNSCVKSDVVDSMRFFLFKGASHMPRIVKPTARLDFCTFKS